MTFLDVSKKVIKIATWSLSMGFPPTENDSKYQTLLTTVLFIGHVTAVIIAVTNPGSADTSTISTPELIARAR